MRSQARASLGESIQAMRGHSSQLWGRPRTLHPALEEEEGRQNTEHRVFKPGQFTSGPGEIKGLLAIALLPVPSYRNASSPYPSTGCCTRTCNCISIVDDISTMSMWKVSPGLVCCVRSHRCPCSLVLVPPSPTHPSKWSSSIMAFQKPPLTPPLNCLYFLLSQFWYMSHFSREFFPDHPLPLNLNVFSLVILSYSIMFFPFMAFIPVCN